MLGRSKKNVRQLNLSNKLITNKNIPKIKLRYCWVKIIFRAKSSFVEGKKWLICLSENATFQFATRFFFIYAHIERTQIKNNSWMKLCAYKCGHNESRLQKKRKAIANEWVWWSSSKDAIPTHFVLLYFVDGKILWILINFITQKKKQQKRWEIQEKSWRRSHT